MKSIFGVSQLGMSLVFCAGVGLACGTALADKGQGSIRAAARPAPPPRAPAHVEAQRPPAREPARAPAEVHRDDHAEGHVQAPPPRVEDQARREWDDHDEGPQHFGGFAKGEPVHVMRGQRIHDLPASHISIIFNSQNYFCDDDGAYYQQQSDGEYLVVQPPVGAIVPSLPSGVTPIAVGPTTYYYLDGVFYVAQGDSFAVVIPPPGIVVPGIPSGADMVVQGGVVFYQFNGFNYQPSIQDGVTVYTVTPM